MATWTVTYRETPDGPVETREITATMKYDHKAPGTPFVAVANEQYQLGEDLLVNAITEPGATEWTTYLPAGDWIDAWTGESVTGPMLHKQTVPIDQVPVYCQAIVGTNLQTVFTSSP